MENNSGFFPPAKYKTSKYFLAIRKRFSEPFSSSGCTVITVGREHPFSNKREKQIVASCNVPYLGYNECMNPRLCTNTQASCYIIYEQVMLHYLSMVTVFFLWLFCSLPFGFCNYSVVNVIFIILIRKLIKVLGALMKKDCYSNYKLRLVIVGPIFLDIYPDDPKPPSKIVTIARYDGSNGPIMYPVRSRPIY